VLTRENSKSKKQPTVSLKTTLMTAIIIVFGILHIAGAVLLQNASASHPSETSIKTMNGD
jgi:hypothetical protein